MDDRARGVREEDLSSPSIPRALAILAALAWASPLAAATQAAGVVTDRAVLPPAGAAYRGAGPHVFLGGQVALTCGSHGSFSDAVEPPRRTGASATSRYTATFVGELALAPPLVERATAHRVVERVAMVETARLAGRRGGTRWFATELVGFDLAGAGVPGGVIVRESPTRTSTGRTTITALRNGGYRVDAFFDVWLEISLDGGRSWHPAEAPVRMALAPDRAAVESRPATLLDTGTGSPRGPGVGPCAETPASLSCRYTRKEVVHHSK